tara:strand:- start:1865 stop:2086 length:222 start_codon:yes stop_codon:yes gene_type:complete
MKVPIKDLDGWFKDDANGSVQCSDDAKYKQYMAAYKAEQKEKEEFQTLQNDVSGLKSEIGEIKSLLLTLADKS